MLKLADESESAELNAEKKMMMPQEQSHKMRRRAMR